VEAKEETNDLTIEGLCDALRAKIERKLNHRFLIEIFRLFLQNSKKIPREDRKAG
jgi:hypothetical protein